MGNVHSAVLVHAAWFDGSSWTRVIAALHRRGFKVDAVQLPLTSFADDVAAIVPDENETVGDLLLRQGVTEPRFE